MPLDTLSDLNPQQQEAVVHTDGPCLIVAGPGSGKTRVLTHRIAYLIQEKKIPPENILAVTFTNKAANEMKERVAKMASTSPPWMGTFHSLCARILRKKGWAIGLEPSFVIYDEADTKDLMRSLMKKRDLSTQKYNPGSILALISAAKNELIGPETYATYAYGPFQKLVAELYPQYQKALRENRALDFDDLLLETIQLFNHSAETLSYYQDQFLYLLVDEYQDTNKAQYVFTKMLAAKHQNVTVVGDMSQAIYSWRGADYRNILNFEKDYPQTKVFRLEENYRSTQNILLAAKSVIQNNRSHISLDLWTKNTKGEPLSLYEAQDELDEARFVLEEMHELHRQWNQCAVLYRTNAQSRAIEEVFIREGVPYRLVGGTKFYERKEIKDVLAYLRLVANPKDTVSAERLEKLGQRQATKFLQQLAEKSDWSSLPPLDLLDLLLVETEYLSRYNEAVEEDLARIENVKELRSVASEFPTLTEFLENVSLVQQEYLPNGKLTNRAERGQDAVTLMTLHAAKGLEFPHVFLVGLEEGLFPHSRALTDLNELEEERRLCYVGLTRAKEKLSLSFARRRLYFGTRQANLISRFVGEIPEDLLQYKSGVKLQPSPSRRREIEKFLDGLEQERWSHF